ncbi:MAG: RagB/SusD family nutrient uptake outer membrane protein [Bacteroidia bacterium]|nr:RagB/SusD family nutrient uptake outer membrane protein [Bacteroidia bacterium]
MKKSNLVISLLVVLFSILICYNAQGLNTIFKGEKIEINTAAVLTSAYNGLRDFNGQGGTYALNEISTDAMVAPARGGDWDDNGAWRQIHTMKWTSNHGEVKNAWNSLVSNIYTCNLIINNGGTPSEVIQARFLRAWYLYNVVDLFGQAPYFDKESKKSNVIRSFVFSEIKIISRPEATDYIIAELESIVNTLSSRTVGNASVANKDAAHFLLAKIYLNKAVFKSPNPAGPYAFNTSDMTKVIQHVDAITNTLAVSYWDNFAPSNNTSNEIIFSSKNNKGGEGGGMQSKWRMGAHFNQTPSGWNGFTTLSDFYNTFNTSDVRAKYSTPSIIATFGNPVGFQVGQQYGPGGITPLYDRDGRPLVFTPQITLITSGSTIETAGIRGMKYIPDVDNLEQPDNDLVLMRYSDALLMKVEAILRGGSGTGTTSILNSLASRANVTAAPATLEGVYAERGRELWWEGWRRNDMIRFGKFLNSRQLKPFVSDAKYLLYPIPTEALYNVNIKQNPGY